VPLRVTPAATLSRLSVMETRLCRCRACGSELHRDVQVAFAAKGLVLTQLSLSTKFAALVPVTAIAVTKSGAVPEFFRTRSVQCWWYHRSGCRSSAPLVSA